MSFDGFRSNDAGAAASRGVSDPTRKDAWNNTLPTEGQNGNPTQIAQNQKTGVSDPDNNTSINDQTIDDIWKDIKKETKNDPNAPPANNQQPQTQQKAPAEALKDYLSQQGLGEFTVGDAMKDQIANGDFSGLQGAILGLVQNAHVKAVSSASALIDQKIADALKKGETATRSLISGKENVAALRAALPFTEDPAIDPVAQTVMQRFLERGADQKTAIAGTKKFFEHTASKVAGIDFTKGRNGNYQTGRVDNEQSGVANWLDVLSPKNQ